MVGAGPVPWRNRWTALKALLLVIAGCLLLSAQVVLGSESSQVPTDITSERMTYLQQDQKVIFEGEVKVTRPDLILTSDLLTVFFTPSEGRTEEGATAGAGEIRRIEAEGRVRLERDGRIGLCARAVYDLEKQLITMEGDPVIQDGKNRISGTLIHFHLADNRSEVIGTSEERVKATFFTPERTAPQGGAKQ
jgi:lipopolysaccharide export system protein LptA